MTTAMVPQTDSDTLGQLEKTIFPNGTEVFYRDSDHSYWAGAKPNAKATGGWSGSGRLTGVSTLCKPFDFQPDSLMRWVERMTLEGVARGFGGKTVPNDPYALRTLLDQRGLRWEQLKDAAGAAGTDIHRTMLHALAAGEDVPDLSTLPEEQRGKGQAVLKWWLDRDPEVLHAEQVVASLEHGVAGRLDLRCRTKDPFHPGVVLMDAKTGNFISNAACVQTAGYDHCVVESELGNPADWLMILKLNSDGTYDEIFVEATHQQFLNAVRVYRDAASFAKCVKSQVRG